MNRVVQRHVRLFAVEDGQDRGRALCSQPDAEQLVDPEAPGAEIAQAEHQADDDHDPKRDHRQNAAPALGRQPGERLADRLAFNSGRRRDGRADGAISWVPERDAVRQRPPPDSRRSMHGADFSFEVRPRQIYEVTMMER